MSTLQSRLDRLSTSKPARIAPSKSCLLICIVLGLFLLSMLHSQLLVGESTTIDQLAVEQGENAKMRSKVTFKKRKPQQLDEEDFEQVSGENEEDVVKGEEVDTHYQESTEQTTDEDGTDDASEEEEDEEDKDEDKDIVNPQAMDEETISELEEEEEGNKQSETNPSPFESNHASDDKNEKQQRKDDSEEYVQAVPHHWEGDEEINSPLINVDRKSSFYKQFYESRFLPPPQLDFYPKFGRQLQYQMHNCLKGRDGSKAGLLDAGIPRVLSQKSLENMPLHIIDPRASIFVACNSKRPVFQITRNSRVAGQRLVSTAQGLLTKLCLGSMKTRQLECRRALTRKWGCSYESLGIQPAQFVMDIPEECEQALEEGHKRDRAWLSKPSGGIRGRGIKYFASTKALEKSIMDRGGCQNSNATGLRGRLVQEYVSQPALIDGKFKFDVRTWLLVASVDPLIVFYHEGFVRVAKQVYNERSRSKMVHITNARGQNAHDQPGARDRSSSSSTGDSGDDAEQTDDEDDEDGKYMRSFEHVSEQLHRHHGLPKDYMQNEFRKQMMRAQTVAALAQFATLEDPEDLITKRGFYQIYACDSMVDRMGGAHLLECNGFPAESQQRTVTGKEIWGEMMALLLNLHLEPWRLMNDSTPPPGIRRFRYMRQGIWRAGPSKMENGETFKANSYGFGGWYLSFNEVETPFDKFNVCKI